MLGKLIKHEWKGTYKVGCLMLLLLAGITFFGWLAFQSPMWRAMATDSESAAIGTGILDILSIFTLLLYVIMLVVIVVGIIVYLAVHFYRTMYTDEGYLTHTLPVTKHQLLVSKILVSGIWEIIVIMMTYLSVFLLALSLIGTIMPDTYTFSEFMEEMGIWFRTLREILEGEFGMNFLLYKIVLVLGSLLGPFVSMTIIFGAISLGQLFTKHRVLMAIVSYIGVCLVNGILGSVIEAIAGSAIFKSSTEDFGGFFNVSIWQGLIVNLILAVVMYITSYVVTTKRLNME